MVHIYTSILPLGISRAYEPVNLSPFSQCQWRPGAPHFRPDKGPTEVDNDPTFGRRAVGMGNMRRLTLYMRGPKSFLCDI